MYHYVIFRAMDIESLSMPVYDNFWSWSLTVLFVIIETEGNTILRVPLCDK